jgi:hypothetical protein
VECNSIHADDKGSSQGHIDVCERTWLARDYELLVADYPIAAAMTNAEMQERGEPSTLYPPPTAALESYLDDIGSVLSDIGTVAELDEYACELKKMLDKSGVSDARAMREIRCGREARLRVTMIQIVKGGEAGRAS